MAPKMPAAKKLEAARKKSLQKARKDLERLERHFVESTAKLKADASFSVRQAKAEIKRLERHPRKPLKTPKL